MKPIDLLMIAILLTPLGACDKEKDPEDGDSKGEEESTTAAEADMAKEPTMQWYTTCGDPVCSGYGGPWPDVPACGEIEEGDPCDMADARCDFMSDCNATLICASSDPKQQVGGCPISRTRFKRDIDYVDAGEQQALYRELLDMRLATYRYRERSDDKLQLGVILEDGEDRIWADPANDRVDLYNYSSLAIVGAQVQAEELAELRESLAALQSEVATLREQVRECK